MSFFSQETWTWTDRKLRDHVVISVFSERGVTMAKARLLFESAQITEGIRAAVELTAHEFPDRPLANIYAPPQVPAQHGLTVGGRPSVRYDTEAAVQLDDAPAVAVHATVWLVDVRGEPLVIQTGYPVSRAAQVGPLVEAFVGSLGFEACK